MPIKLANNASGTLATAISASDTGITLTTGDGAEFPTLGAGDYFYATITSTQGTQEIVKATARSGDSLTVVRAQEGTTPAGFAAGSRFELRVTVQSVRDWAEVYTPAGTSAVTTTVQAKLRETVSAKDFGVVGDGVTDDTTAITNAITYAASIGAELHVIGSAGNNVAFTGNLTIPGSPSPSLGKLNGGAFTALTPGGKVIFGQINNGVFRNITFNTGCLVEDQGTRDCVFESITARQGWLISATLRDVLWNHYDTCEFGFGLTSGVSFDVQAPLSPNNNPFNSNQFDSCKFRGSSTIVNLRTDLSTASVRGLVFNNCDFANIGGTTMIVGATSSGWVFNGGYHEGGGRYDFKNSGGGNAFFGSRFDDSYVDGIEKFSIFAGGSVPRLGFGWTSRNGTTLGNGRPRATAGGALVGGWGINASTGISNDAAAPAGFSGTDALKITTVNTSAANRIALSIPPEVHKGGGVSVAARVYVPAVVTSDNPELSVVSSTGLFNYYQITQRDEWVNISMGLSGADPTATLTAALFLARVGRDLANYMYVDWIVVGVGGMVSLYDRSETDHHNQGGTLQHYGDFQMFESSWERSRLLLGDYYLWVDATGDLRIKNGAPTSDTDGTVVGAQT